uniref:Protein-tyrosine-phosphatase n=1 Tax=Panagrellus redivivus TaxID=6233 RepID=A0A7E4VST9_PANRE
MIKLSLLALTLTVFLVELHARNLPEPNVKNLRARFESVSNSIYVEWEYADTTPSNYGIGFVVRYRITNRLTPDSQWKLTRTRERVVRLDLQDIQSGDEVEVQVKVERGGQVVEDWNQQLLISIAKRLNVGGILVEESDLLPPLEFAANVLSPTSVKLEWLPFNPHVNGIYYVVNVEQLTAYSGERNYNQQIKIEATNFILDDLNAGEKYEFTIRSAKSANEISSTAAIVEITMPKEDEYFEVGNLIISSRFKSNGQGTVNLTWEVPPTMSAKIREYHVEYAPEGVNNFVLLKFTGQKPSATLTDLQSDTEYVLKIKTILVNNLETQSGEFRFRTPKVAVNPISKVDVIYSSSENNAVRLQWILEPHVSLDSISGYDVYISEDKDKPETEWRYLRLDGKEASLSIGDLKTSTTYYARINIRRSDGQVTQAPSIYRFKTIDQFPRGAELRQANSLAYRNIAPGRVSISWTYPTTVSAPVVGAIILYTDRKDAPLDQWTRIDVNDAHTKSIVLDNLREGTRYYVHIVPRLNNNELDYANVEKFELRTDSPAHSRAFEHAYQGRRDTPQFQEMRVSADEGEKHINIVYCNPDAFKTGCAWDEHCIASVDNPNVGWCIPDGLRDSIIKSTSK